MSGRSVSVDRLITAAPAVVWDVVTDPRRHPEIDGSGTVRRALSGPERLTMGSRFGMGMVVGVPYPIRNVVVEYEEGRLIAWRHFHGHRWRWELTPAEGGTRVTHTFDWSRALAPRYVARAGWPERNRRAMERTLERLQQVVADRA